VGDHTAAHARGGAWLCYEGAEKVSGALFRHATESHAEVAGPAGGDPQSVEDAKVRAAISTDLILSAEIMAIALATLPDIALPIQAAILSAVAFGITVAVYGTVALIVKADDDAGVALAASGNRFVAALGRGLVRGMPPLLAGLSILGTAAMVWVGGGIIVHGLEAFGLGALGHAIDRAGHAVGALVPAADGAISWAVAAAGAGDGASPWGSRWSRSSSGSPARSLGGFARAHAEGGTACRPMRPPSPCCRATASARR